MATQTITTDLTPLDWYKLQKEPIPFLMDSSPIASREYPERNSVKTHPHSLPALKNWKPAGGVWDIHNNNESYDSLERMEPAHPPTMVPILLAYEKKSPSDRLSRLFLISSEKFDPDTIRYNRGSLPGILKPLLKIRLLLFGCPARSRKTEARKDSKNGI